MWQWWSHYHQVNTIKPTIFFSILSFLVIHLIQKKKFFSWQWWWWWSSSDNCHIPACLPIMNWIFCLCFFFLFCCFSHKNQRRNSKWNFYSIFVVVVVLTINHFIQCWRCCCCLTPFWKNLFFFHSKMTIDYQSQEKNFFFFFHWPNDHCHKWCICV